MDQCPIDLFLCERMHARLTRQSCASNWESVVGKKRHELVRLHQCSGCPIGAENAGRKFEPTPLPRFCPRCLRLSPRLIGERLCVSCQNREYEWLKGRNARGTPVQKLRLYHCVVLTETEQDTVRFAINATSRIEVAYTAFRRDVTARVGWCAG